MSRGPGTLRWSPPASLPSRGWLALALALAPPLPAGAGPSPYIWDQDEDRVDDRLESVNLLGYSVSFENSDTLSRQRIQVLRDGGGLLYGVYVIYDQPVTDSDLTALAGVGMPALHRIAAVPAVRSLATFAQVEAAATLPGVHRVEATPILYPLLRDNVGSIAARDPTERVFPTWSGTAGPAGEGVVVAILDTGVNDQAEGTYPGHESVAGGFLGGARFLAADSTLDTAREGSENPSDHGGAVTAGHGTHVAGAVLGTGGPLVYARGVAPAARFVDVKVLNDAGLGTGLPEALDWCLHNATRDWGVPGYEGIDVINLSLSSLDPSDGNDLASRLATEAVARGIVVVASMGNEGRDGYVPSPAAGDGVIAVGALDAQRTPMAGDDQFAAFSNRGPRASDQDEDTLDELKPDLLAPGVAVLSADGEIASDGRQYRRLTGTSVAAALASGAVACLRSAAPGLSPAAIATLLRETAWRGVAGLPPGPDGSDPRWQAARGYGALDLHAAKLELESPDRTQVTRLELEAGADAITACAHTQREIETATLVFERAADDGGVPLAFAPYDSVPAAGDGSLADAENRRVYERVWQVPGDERGAAFWYRVTYTSSGVQHATPARRFISPLGPSAATLEVCIVHNAYDTDVGAVVVVGAETETVGEGLSLSLPGSNAAVASEWVTGTAEAGNVEWTFLIPVPSGTANYWLPPDPASPWWLRVTEGGFLNRSGRVTAYRLTQHLSEGDEVFEGYPMPLPTAEGQTSVAAIPATVLAVGEPPGPATTLRAGPNPVRSGGELRFALEGCGGRAIEVFDLTGRRVARVPVSAAAGGCRGTWSVRDARGEALPAGVYLAWPGGGTATRIVVLAP
jgi:hypothetical protein